MSRTTYIEKVKVVSWFHGTNGLYDNKHVKVLITGPDIGATDTEMTCSGSYFLFSNFLKLTDLIYLDSDLYQTFTNPPTPLC